MNTASKLLVSACPLALFALCSQVSFATELQMPTYQLDESFGPWWRAAAEEFAKENPGNSIKLIPVSFNEHHDQLTTRFVAGDPPDLAHISARFYFQYADQGFLEPLDDRLKSIGWKEGDFIPSQRQLKRNGHVYGQLLLGYGWGLFYNKDMLKAAGVSLPTNKQELMAAARKLTVTGSGRVERYGLPVVSDQSSEAYMSLTYLLTGLGYSWVEEGALVSKEHLREALAMTDELIKENASPAGLNNDQRRQLFWQGDAAMYIDGSWAVGFKDKADPKVKKAYGVAPLPFEGAAGGPSNVLAIPASLPEDRKALAFKFIELIQSPEWQRKYAEMTGNPPARIQDLSDAAKEKWPEMSVFVSSAQNTKQSYLPEGKETDFAKWSAIVYAGVSGLASGALTVDQAVDQIHEELSSEFF